MFLSQSNDQPETPGPNFQNYNFSLPCSVVLRNFGCLFDAKSRNFDTREEAVVSPLAERLFEVEGVTGVFLGSDFITIHKSDDREWFLIKPSILGLIMEHFTAGRPVMREDSSTVESSEEDSEVVTQIKDLLDTRVRPAVAMDGGDIVFHEFKEGVVFLHLRGACAGCPSSTATLKMGIENMLKHYVPEVREVTAV